MKHIDKFVSWFGARPSRAIDFFPYNDWGGMTAGARWAAHCWSATGYRMTFSLPMIPNDHQSTLGAGARGDYDHIFQSIARDMVASGFRSAVIRIGWEFNGGWYAWAAKKDPGDWVLFWRRIVVAMRSVPGQAFAFDWCPTVGMQQIAPDSVYPGDAFVDIIGMDVYNYNSTLAIFTADPKSRWKSFVEGAFGLRWQAKFAALHKKRLSFPEWATGTRPDGHGPGDDPYFVTQMAIWIKSHDVYYHDYWDFDAPDYRSALHDGEFPKSGKAFMLSFAP